MKTLRSFLMPVICLTFAASLISQNAFATTASASAGSTPATASVSSSNVSSNQTASAPININTASADQLDTLKGIGPKKAQAIVDYRTQNGNFKSVDDLANVKGISQKILSQNRDHMTVS